MRRESRSHLIPVIAGIVLFFWATFGASQTVRLNNVSEELGAPFYLQFRTLADLSQENIETYFTIYPNQVNAFATYVQRLVDNGLLHELHGAKMLSATSFDGESSASVDVAIPLPTVKSSNPNRQQTGQEGSSLTTSDSSDATQIELAKQNQTEYYMALISELENHAKPLDETEGQIYQETRAIAVQLNLVIPLWLLRTQSRNLSQEFGQNFRSKEQFSSAEFRSYFANRPSEIWALREYIQELSDLELIPHSMAISAVTIAFDAASNAASHSQAGRPIVEPSQSPQESPNGDQEFDIAELPVGVLPEAVGAYLDRGDKSSLIEFGAIPEIRGPTSVESAEEIIKELEERERRQKLALTAAKIMRAFAQNNIPRAEIGGTVAQIFREEAEQELSRRATDKVDKSLDKLVDNATASVGFSSGEPSFKIKILKSFESSPHDSLYGFTQFSGLRANDETSINVGFGIRALDQTKTMLFGANTFYDRQLDDGHDRLGLGVEIVSTPLKLNANRYFALSGKKQISSTTTEQALDGRDIKFKGALPYLPGLFAGYTDFKWYGADGGSDLQGQKYGLSGKLSDSFNLSIGRTSYDSGQSGQNSLMLTYNYVDKPGWSPRLYQLSPIPWQVMPISGRERYQFVDREDEIVKQTTVGSGSTLAITFSSI